MRRLLIWFGLVALAATPALADITARYRVAGGEGKTVSIAVADDGRARLDGGDGPTLITRDGVGYFVAPNGQGHLIGRQDDALAIATEFLTALMAMIPEGQQEGGLGGVRAMAAAPFDVAERGTETVGGRTGTVYAIAPGAGGEGPTVEIVLSRDDDLAPVGREMLRMLALAEAPASALLGGTPDLIVEIRALLESGTPIRIGDQFVLDGVSADPIAPEAFVLPGPVLTRDELRTVMGGMAAAMMPPMGEGEEAAD